MTPGWLGRAMEQAFADTPPCPVCGDDRQVRRVASARGQGVVPCPRCAVEPPLPIYVYDMRDDTKGQP